MGVKVKNLPLINIVIQIICFAYATLFIYAAIYKLLDFGLFKRQLALSPLLSFSPKLIAIVIPNLEIIIALGLFFKHFQFKAIKYAIALMGLFTLYIVYILFLSKKIPCSCGGILATMGWFDHLIFNSIFIALGLMAYKLMLKKRFLCAKEQEKPKT